MISFKTFGIVTIVAVLALAGILTYKPTLSGTTQVKEAQKIAPITKSHGNSEYDNYGGSDYDGNYINISSAANPYVGSYDNYNYGNGYAIYANTQPNSGGPAISAQILANQQNINNQMQSCINYARQAASQLNSLKNQEEQVQQQIDSLNNQLSDIDTSTDGGQQQADSINNHIQQLQNQINAIDTRGNQGEDNYNNTLNTCQDKVNQLEQHRQDLESQLDDAFNTTLNNIQIP